MRSVISTVSISGFIGQIRPSETLDGFRLVSWNSYPGSSINLQFYDQVFGWYLHSIAKYKYMLVILFAVVCLDLAGTKFSRNLLPLDCPFPFLKEETLQISGALIDGFLQSAWISLGWSNYKIYSGNLLLPGKKNGFFIYAIGLEIFRWSYQWNGILRIIVGSEFRQCWNSISQFFWANFSQVQWRDFLSQNQWRGFLSQNQFGLLIMEELFQSLISYFWHIFLWNLIWIQLWIQWSRTLVESSNFQWDSLKLGWHISGTFFS